MSSLKLLPQSAITAARLRDMARDLILQAEALEAELPRRKRRNREVRIITREELSKGARDGVN